MASRAAALLLAALVLGACGASSGGTSRSQEATLTLDFQPNAIHSGIFLAVDRDFTGAAGVDLDVEPPSSSSDGAKLLLSGRTDFAVLDLHDLALARERGRDLVAVMAIVQRPLAAVLAQPGIRRPRELEGRRVGVSGLPSDLAVLRSIVRGDGGEPRRVRTTRIGFTAVQAMLGRKVDGATAFWNAEGVALRARRPGVREFRLERFGAPSYPELVLVTTRRTLQDDPALVRAVVGGLRRGYREVLGDPEGGIAALTAAEPGIDRVAAERELGAVSSAFTAGAATFGELRPAELRRWARWEAESGITRRPPDVDRMFAPAFSTAGVVE